MKPVPTMRDPDSSRVRDLEIHAISNLAGNGG